ncbi:membrane protein [Pseudomonas phage PlaquesPlease]|uniref:Membrane protein n=1 Tax=Pseudomonas phage PlaquesPlease TaxID=2762289 RepID=A0A7G8LJR7_9CAUD|nr:membrane protein [Pseudomonas phage PlaquesPlease]
MIHIITRKAAQITLAMGLCVGVLMATMPAAEARGGYSGGSRSSSSFSSSRSFSKPSSIGTFRSNPKPRVVKHTTVNRTTVIHQNVNAAPSASSGIMSSFIGSFAGSSLANWWFNDDDKAEEAKPVVEQQAAQ